MGPSQRPYSERKGYRNYESQVEGAEDSPAPHISPRWPYRPFSF